MLGENYSELSIYDNRYGNLSRREAVIAHLALFANAHAESLWILDFPWTSLSMMTQQICRNWGCQDKEKLQKGKYWNWVSKMNATPLQLIDKDNNPLQGTDKNEIYMLKEHGIPIEKSNTVKASDLMLVESDGVATDLLQPALQSDENIFKVPLPKSIKPNKDFFDKFAGQLVNQELGKRQKNPETMDPFKVRQITDNLLKENPPSKKKPNNSKSQKKGPGSVKRFLSLYIYHPKQ